MTTAGGRAPEENGVPGMSKKTTNEVMGAAITVPSQRVRAFVASGRQARRTGRRNRNVLPAREDSEHPANNAWRPRSKKFSASQGQTDYISLTDMLKAKDSEFFISDWLRNRNTVEFFGIWESIFNPAFNSGEFAGIKSMAGLNSYKLSVKEWVEKTGAQGLVASAGPDRIVVQRTAAQLPWRSNLTLLEKLDAPEQRLWYADKAIQQRLSRDMRAVQIESRWHERQRSATHNFAVALPPPGSGIAAHKAKMGASWK